MQNEQAIETAQNDEQAFIAQVVAELEQTEAVAQAIEPIITAEVEAVTPSKGNKGKGKNKGKGNKVAEKSAQINKSQVTDKDQLLNAIAHANEQYKARKGASANLGKTGFNPDLSKAHKIVSGLTDAQLKEIAELEIAERLIAGLRDASNTKKPMRIMQALLFAVTGSGSFLKGSAKTFLLEFCGLVIAGAKNRAGLRFCATGVGSEHTSDEVYSTAKARKLLSAFGAIKVATESTQNSVSFSKGGIAETLGLAKKDSRTGLPVVNLENKVAQRLNHQIEKLTDNSLALLVAQASQRDNS